MNINEKYIIPETLNFINFNKYEIDKIIKGLNYLDKNYNQKYILKESIFNTIHSDFYKYLFKEEIDEMIEFLEQEEFIIPNDYPRIFLFIQKIEINGWKWFIDNYTKISNN